MDSLVGGNCFQGCTAELKVCNKNNSSKINKLGLWGIYKESWEICRVNPENQMVNRVLLQPWEWLVDQGLLGQA